MKRIFLALTILMTGSTVWAQQAGQFGAGVILGDPTGLTVKYWLDGTKAIDAGVGFSGDATLYTDFLWHSWDILPQPKQGKLGLYVGGGPQIDTEDSTEFGIRAIGGIDYWIANHPIELFLEGGPAFMLTTENDEDREIDFNAGLGVRFYFGVTGGGKK